LALGRSDNWSEAAYLSIMTEQADIVDIDPETLALLRETGIDPQAYLKRRAEMRAWRRTPEEAAKLAADQDEFREAIESTNRFFDEHGLWSDGLRSW
jgi:post-segregation antitoxin (ccd killing protein)